MSGLERNGRTDRCQVAGRVEPVLLVPLVFRSARHWRLNCARVTFMPPTPPTVLVDASASPCWLLHVPESRRPSALPTTSLGARRSIRPLRAIPTRARSSRYPASRRAVAPGSCLCTAPSASTSACSLSSRGRNSALLTLRSLMSLMSWYTVRSRTGPASLLWRCPLCTYGQIRCLERFLSLFLKLCVLTSRCNEAFQLDTAKQLGYPVRLLKAFLDLC